MRILFSILITFISATSAFPQYQIHAGIFNFDFSNKPINITNRSYLIALGDSFTTGLNASPGSNAYIPLFVAAKPAITTLNNLAQGGKGVWVMANAIQNVSYLGGQSATIVSAMAGYNDMRRGSSAFLTRKKIQTCYRSVVLNGIANVFAPAGSASVTRTGTWTSYNASSVGGRYPGGTIPSNMAVISIVSGSTMTWTFTGSDFGVQFSGADSTHFTYGTGTITIDGKPLDNINLNVWYDGISDGVNSNQRGPVAFTWHNFKYESHTVVLTTTSNNSFAVDFFATINTPLNSPCFVFFEIPYSDATGYAVTPEFGSVAASDICTALIKTIVTDYIKLGYSICYVPTNSYFSLMTGLSGDHIHPNNTGHTQIFNAMSAYVFP